MTPRRAVVLALLAIVLVGCEGRPHPAHIVVGIALTSNAHAGVVLAAEEINAAGGIGGARIELAGLDRPDGDAYNPEAVLENAARLASTPDLLAVIGHNDSASTLAAAASYNRAGVPQLVTIATNPAITNIGSWTYRLCLSDAVQGPALATYAVKDWEKKRIAIIYVNDDYGRALARLFEERARSLGAQIVATAMHHNALQPDDHETIRAAIEELRTTNADLVVLFQRVAAAKWTVRAIRDAGVPIDILGGDNLAQYTFSGETRDIANRIRVSQFVNLDATRPRVARFLQQIRAKTGREADYAQAYSYDAVYLLQEAITHGGYSRAGIKGYLDTLIARQQPVGGITGSFVLGRDHDARRPLYVAAIRDGAFQVLKTLAVEQGEWGATGLSTR